MAFTIAPLLFALTIRASPNSLAAPAISLRIKTPTPLPSVFVAINSFAIKFIPSLRGVTKATSATLYSAVSLLKGRNR